jgi:hypothetical protein
MFVVTDSPTHEHAAEGRVGNWMCQTSGERRKDEEDDGEEKERIFKHGLS